MTPSLERWEQQRRGVLRAWCMILSSNHLDLDLSQGTVSKIRTSSGMFFARSECRSELSIHAVPTDLMPCHVHTDETGFIGRIEDRIARWTMTDVGQGEGIQVLRYDVSQRSCVMYLY